MTTKQRLARMERLLPGGVPKWIRCYDNGGETIDRYTVVYTNRKDGVCLCVGMSGEPYHPQGVGQHGEFERWEMLKNGQTHIDRPKYAHLGRPIPFDALPRDCQRVVLSDYRELWELSEEGEAEI